ncbi:MAG: hypothetical protein ACM3NH_03065 [Candidatus Saccharibacteria bacterium]
MSPKSRFRAMELVELTEYRTFQGSGKRPQDVCRRSLVLLRSPRSLLPECEYF